MFIFVCNLGWFACYLLVMMFALVLMLCVCVAVYYVLYWIICLLVDCFPVNGSLCVRLGIGFLY